MSRLLAFLFLCGSLQATEVCVLTRTPDGNGGWLTGRGTGVVVCRKGELYSIATARHVIRDVEEAYVGTRGEWVKVRSAHVIKSDDDFAVLQVRLPNELKLTSVSETDAKPGEPIEWSGYSDGTKHETMRGVVKAVGSVGEASCKVRCKHGQSGGGVYRAGELVGIVNGYNTGTGELIYVPVCHIRRRCHQEWGWFFNLGPLPPQGVQVPFQRQQPRTEEPAPPPPTEPKPVEPQVPAVDYRGQIDSLRSEVERLKASRIPVQILNPDGTIHDQATYKLGNPIKLKLSPVKK